MVSNQSTDLNQLLELNKEEILTRWFESTINSYPEDTARILGKSKNRFDNPVGSATRQGLEDTFKCLLAMPAVMNYKQYVDSREDFSRKKYASDEQNTASAGNTQDVDYTVSVDQNKIETALDSVIRIRAVQNFSASQAVSFVFELKTIVKSVLGELSDDSLDYRIDLVALAAFNRFMKCRENIFLLKATESKRRVHRAFERAGLVTELTEEELLGSSKS